MLIPVCVFKMQFAFGNWTHILLLLKYVNKRDFPGGPVVKNLPCNAGDVGSIPGWGTKIPRATEQLNLQAVTTEPMSHNWAHEPQLEYARNKVLHDAKMIPHATTKTQCSHTHKKNVNKSKPSRSTVV